MSYIINQTGLPNLEVCCPIGQYVFTIFLYLFKTYFIQSSKAELDWSQVITTLLL
jgi:hypothetical protein